MEATLYTVGHSDRTQEGFMRILKEEGITTLIDIRAYP